MPTHTPTAVAAVRPAPPAGDFDGAALASGRTIEPARWASDEPLLGLVREAGYVWGTVRDDATGDLVSLMRRIPARADTGPAGGDAARALGGRLVVLSTRRGADSLELCREPRAAVRSEHLTRVRDGDAVRFVPEAGAPGRPARLELRPDRVDYVEQDVLELAGPLAAPALQWYLPGPASALLYLTQTWQVSGTVLGRPVSGFLFFEEAYMPPGGRLYVAADPLHDVRYTTWYSWANRYADGTTEVGHFLFGQRDFHVGVVARSDGTVEAARRMDAVVTRAPDGHWHDGIDYDLDGVRWVCEPDPRGRMSGLGPMPNPQQEGRVRRRDDPRTPELWMAWGESVPGNGERRG